MTHAQLVQQAVIWLRAYVCGVILSEQCSANWEMPDAIGWKRACHSVLIECKISRSDFLADRDKPFRQKSELGVRTLLPDSAAFVAQGRIARRLGLTRIW